MKRVVVRVPLVKREIEMRVRMEIMEDMPMVIRIVIRRKETRI